MEKDKLRELYIFGEPIETELGDVRFLTYKEYLLNAQYLTLMNMNVLHIYYQLRKMTDEKDSEAMAELDNIKKASLFSIVMQLDYFREAYIKIFQMVFDDKDSVAKAFSSEECFDFYRNLILDMQIMVEDEVSPNPEIQKGIEMSKKVKQDKAEKQTFTDIITSIVAGTGNSFKDVCEMTVYQVYAVFYRMGAMKSYDTETLFATVSAEVQISSWSRNIDLFTSEGSTIDRDTFDKSYGKFLN